MVLLCILLLLVLLKLLLLLLLLLLTATATATTPPTPPTHTPILILLLPAAQVNEEQYAQRQLRVEERHVLRAFDQVKLCHDLIGVFTRGYVAGPSVVPEANPVSEALTSAARLDAALEGQRLPVSQFDPFVCSQASLALAGVSGRGWRRGEDVDPW